MKEQQHNLKSQALSTLNEIAKHNEDVAQIIVDVPTLPYVMNFLSPNFTDVKVKVSNYTIVKKKLYYM